MFREGVVRMAQTKLRLITKDRGDMLPCFRLEPGAMAFVRQFEKMARKIGIEIIHAMTGAFGEKPFPAIVFEFHQAARRLFRDEFRPALGIGRIFFEQLSCLLYTSPSPRD